MLMSNFKAAFGAYGLYSEIYTELPISESHFWLRLPESAYIMVRKDRVIVVRAQITPVAVPAFFVEPPLAICQHLDQILDGKPTLTQSHRVKSSCSESSVSICLLLGS